MGLDLTLYAKNTKTEVETELCYGRKTWCLWFYFLESPYTEVLTPQTELLITKNAWDRFCKDIEEIKPILKNAIKCYEILEYLCRDNDENLKLISNLQEQTYLFEKWYDNFFEVDPTLGYDWDAIALLDWYDKRDSVYKYLNELEVLGHTAPSPYVVVLNASY